MFFEINEIQSFTSNPKSQRTRIRNFAFIFKWLHMFQDKFLFAQLVSFCSSLDLVDYFSLKPLTGWLEFNLKLKSVYRFFWKTKRSWLLFLKSIFLTLHQPGLSVCSMSYSGLFRTTILFPLDEVFATAALPPFMNHFRPSSHVLLV